jgi:hypothetical protein
LGSNEGFCIIPKSLLLRLPIQLIKDTSIILSFAAMKNIAILVAVLAACSAAAVVHVPYEHLGSASATPSLWGNHPMPQHPPVHHHEPGKHGKQEATSTTRRVMVRKITMGKTMEQHITMPTTVSIPTRITMSATTRALMDGRLT